MQDRKLDNNFWDFSPELTLMLASASSNDAKLNQTTINSLLTQPMDWDLLVKMAVHHRVYPLVYKTLSSLDKLVIPEISKAVLQQKCKGNTMKSLGITGATIKLVRALEEKNIQSIVLKGPVLAEHLYGELSLRPFKDIDLLVWPEELEQVGQILEEQGYHRTHPNFSLTPARRKVYIQKFHHFNYWHSELKIEVELHWKLGHTGWELPLPKGSSLRRIQVSGYSLPVLENEIWLLFLVMHGASHGWFRLRWLCDIGEFMRRKDIDWEKVKQLADVFGMRAIFHQALILANQLLKVAVPGNIQSAVMKDEKAWQLAKLTVALFINAHEEHEDAKGGQQWRLYWRQKKYEWQMRTGAGKKFHYVLDMFKPSEEDIEQLSLPDRLYWVYYMIRPFTWLWRRR